MNPICLKTFVVINRTKPIFIWSRCEAFCTSKLSRKTSTHGFFIRSALSNRRHFLWSIAPVDMVLLFLGIFSPRDVNIDQLTPEALPRELIGRCSHRAVKISQGTLEHSHWSFIYHISQNLRICQADAASIMCAMATPTLTCPLAKEIVFFLQII